MAELRFRRTAYPAGERNAAARVSYITRQPMHAVSRAEQQLRYIAEGREDCLFTASRNLPPWAEGNPHVFFQAAETYERANGIAFEEFKIALPVELTRRDNMALMHDLVDAIAGDKLPCTVAFHCPRTMQDTSQQPHLHLLISARQNDGIARTARHYFRRWNATHPERGGAQKAPAFGHMGAVMAHRVLIADVLNLHLERGGHAARVHPGTLKSQGIAREPEPKLRPSESHAYREKGVVSTTMAEVLAIRAERQHTRAEEHRSATEYWQERKAALGITTKSPHKERLVRVVAARTHAVKEKPVRTASHVIEIEVERQVRQRVPAQGLRHLTALLERHQEAESHASGNLHVRLHERDREQGMGI